MLTRPSRRRLDEPLDLSDYLSFAYSDAAGTTRTWSLERYDAKEGNSSMADGRYIYRIVPAKGQDPIRLAFTDEEGHRSNSDDFEIELEDLYQIYDMTIYAGALISSERSSPSPTSVYAR